MLCLWCGREPVAIVSIELPGIGRAHWPTCDGHRGLAGREVTDALGRLVVPASSAPPADVIDAASRDDVDSGAHPARTLASIGDADAAPGDADAARLSRARPAR